MKQPIKSALAVSAGVVAVVGLVLAPAAVFAVGETSTGNTTIEATVGSTISLTTTGTAVALSITPTAGGSESRASDVVTVNTNNAAGYTLGLADSDATTTLANGANTLAAHTGTLAAPTALASNTWGFAIAGAPFDATYTAQSNVQGATTKWAGVPASGAPAQIKSTSAVATNETTTVWYAAKVDTSRPNGLYTGTVTYTATAK